MPEDPPSPPDATWIPDQGPAAPHALPERYEDLGPIGEGGGGQVRRVRDRRLGRTLAMKILPSLGDPGSPTVTRFLAEARVTARLEHPGVVPVHDQGVLADGRPWYTMREVRGDTLTARIEALHGDGPEGWKRAGEGALRRIVAVLLQVTQAVAYAHSEGVVHRDLKPDNILVGPFGEVQVVDFGLVRALPDPDGPSVGPTRHGTVMGTPAYMAPEQARGDLEAHGPPTDVYALGAVLYTILGGRPPYAGHGEHAWRRVLAGPPDPLGPTPSGEPPPPPLVELLQGCMAREPEDRLSAPQVVEGLQDWLDGARARERALAEVAAAAPRLERARTLARRATEVRQRARAIRRDMPKWKPVSEKKTIWDLEDEASAAEAAVAEAQVDGERHLQAALALAPDLSEAHQALADLHREVHDAAEARGDRTGAARALARIRTHDRGGHASWLAGDGAWTLVTDPVCQVTLHRLELRDRRWIPTETRQLGSTPLRAVRLPHGRYLARLDAPGCEPVSLPVVVERATHADGVPPGESDPHPIRLPRVGELAPDERYVPAGYAILGDPTAYLGLPRRRIWLDGFALRRDPVTNAEYLAWLNQLVEEGREGEAEQWQPRYAAAGGARGAPVYGREGPRFALVPDKDGDRWDPQWPVVQVSWEHARAYAEDLARRTARGWRLPWELEREKATRGVDGRSFPWGDEPEATWFCNSASRPGRPLLMPVGEPPEDESIYGIRGLAGNCRDWCADIGRMNGPDLVEASGRWRFARPAALEPGEHRRISRGGGWSGGVDFGRAGHRQLATQQWVHVLVGIRLARDLG